MIKTCIVILHLGKIVGAFCMPNVDMVECRAAIDEREALRPGFERAGFDADAVTLDCGRFRPEPRVGEER